MPKQHKSGNQTQKNKPFKGSSKRQSKNINGKIIKKAISKNQVNVKVDKVEIEKQPQEVQQVQPTIIKSLKQPKIIAVIPFNSAADTQKLRQMLQQSLGIEDQLDNQGKQQIHLKVGPGKNSTQQTILQYYQVPFLKQNLHFVFAQNNFESILDACKVADVICPVLSCRDTNMDGLTLDPQKNASAFDGLGYKVLSALRVQGLPPQVCLIQDLAEINANKRSYVRKFFNRYFASEFGGEVTVLSDEQSTSAANILRYIQGVNYVPMEWRDQHGYMLPEEITYQDNLLTLKGVWRGTTAINANQLVHITGVDDFSIEKIELITQATHRGMDEEQSKQAFLYRDESVAVIISSYKYKNNQHTLDPFCKKKEDQDINEQFLDQIGGLDLGDDLIQLLQKPITMVDEEIEDQESDVSYDEADEQQDPQEKKLIDFEVTKRDDDELEFEDEVEYDVETQLRDRYSKYQGLKNFRDTFIDPFTFLPDEVDCLYNIRNLMKVKQDALQTTRVCQSIQPGQTVKIYLRAVPQAHLQKIFEPNRICIVSGLLDHERKMTQMHAKVRRAPRYEELIESKKSVQIQVGFRRAHVEPIYSRIYNNCPKTKYIKKMNSDTWYLASFYFFCTFPPSKILMFQSGNMMCTGEVQRCDTFQIIMKRVILTGYPFKINKRKAVIRLMFFQPQDIRYFKPVDLTTKLGLKGNIVEPLGTHGLMKCMFNTYVRPNDTICLHLYKRVHPRFPQALKGL